MALGHEKLDEDKESRERKAELDRMAAMLSRLGKRGYSVQEEPEGYGVDPDFDSDLLAPSFHLRSLTNMRAK